MRGSSKVKDVQQKRLRHPPSLGAAPHPSLRATFSPQVAGRRGVFLVNSLQFYTPSLTQRNNPTRNPAPFIRIHKEIHTFSVKYHTKPVRICEVTQIYKKVPIMTYSSDIQKTNDLIKTYNGTWDGISAESVVRMKVMNRFKTGLDIAQYTAAIMRKDMAAYDANPAHYTQSLGCWHGFIGQQKMISIKKYFGTTKGRYLYLSGWMIAALRSEFGPLPDQSMHEKTSVPALIEELYTFLRQADARELNLLFRDLDTAAGNATKQKEIQAKIDTYETHVVPIIADIDAGFGNAEATYLLAKKMIEAGACALQIENQVSDEKQCGHQDGKVTVPHEVFLAKVRACRYAFLELGIENGIIVTRTDSLGAGLTQQLAFSKEPGDLGDQYNAFLDCEEITTDQLQSSDVVIKRDGKLLRPKRLASNLYQFRSGTGEARCVLDCITSLQNGADLLWIETEKPHIAQIAGMVDEIRKVVPNAKLVYNNSPSFNWTLNFRQQVFDAMQAGGKDVSKYDRAKLMSVDYDGTELGQIADERIRTFQRDAAARAGIFHHLITLPTYHTAALSTDNLAREYFGDQAMLGYVKNVQRAEIRQGIACVKHQNMSGSDIGDDHKEYFAGESALKAGGADNTMNQFAA
jgi:isocitrate lyase